MECMRLPSRSAIPRPISGATSRERQCCNNSWHLGGALDSGRDFAQIQCWLLSNQRLWLP
eukprot:11158722-Karenia_brevis.AAC.1